MIDTSHLCVLARAASRLELDSAPSGQVFDDLLGIHYCNGQRSAVTSNTVYTEEQDLTQPQCPLHLYATLPPTALDGKVDPWHDNSYRKFDHGEVGDRDQTLVAVADIATDNGQTTQLLTDDLSLYQWVWNLAATDQLAAFPELSIVFIGKLAQCGALSPIEVASIAEAEEIHLAGRVLSEAFRQRKQQKINAVIGALGFVDRN